MAADLATDLREAEADGVSAEEFLGSSAFDPRSFAASWAAERGIVPVAGQPRERQPQTTRPRRAHRRCSDRTDRGSAAIPDRAAEGVGGCRPEQRDCSFPRHHQARFGPPGPSGLVVQHKRIHPGRVDPSVARDRRARLRCMAVVEPRPLAATRRPGLAGNSHVMPVSIVRGDDFRSPALSRTMTTRSKGAHHGENHDLSLVRHGSRGGSAVRMR